MGFFTVIKGTGFWGDENIALELAKRRAGIDDLSLKPESEYSMIAGRFLTLEEFRAKGFKKISFSGTQFSTKVEHNSVISATISLVYKDGFKAGWAFSPKIWDDPTDFAPYNLAIEESEKMAKYFYSKSTRIEIPEPVTFSVMRKAKPDENKGYLALVIGVLFASD